MSAAGDLEINKTIDHGAVRLPELSMEDNDDIEDDRDAEDDVIVINSKERVKNYLVGNRNKIMNSILYTIVLGCVGLLISSLGPALPTLQRQTNATESQMGWLFVSRGTGYMFSGLVSGRVYDKLGEASCFSAHKLLAIGTACLGLSAALTPLVSSLPVLCVC